jgi:hypothetical protein
MNIAINSTICATLISKLLDFKMKVCVRKMLITN